MKRHVKKVPGFRSGTRWKQFFASLVYVFVFLFVILALVQSFVFGGVTLTLFIVSIIFLFDLDDIWLRLKLPKHDPLLRPFVIFLFILIAFTLWYAFVPEEVRAPGGESVAPSTIDSPAESAQPTELPAND